MSRKFDTSKTERLYTKFQPDETIEPGDGMGWLGLYLVEGRGGVIIYEDAHGFTDGTYFESPNLAWIAWTEAKDKWTPEVEGPTAKDILIVIPEVGSKESWTVQHPNGLNAFDTYIKAMNFSMVECDRRGGQIQVWTIDQKAETIRVYPEPVDPSR